MIEQALEVAAGGTDGDLPQRRRRLARRRLRAGHLRAHSGRASPRRELLELVRGIARHGLVGVDVVETAPSLDASSATAAIAGRVVMDALAAHAGALDGVKDAYDLIVIGGGPSGGLPAAAYLQKAGLDVLVVEANSELARSAARTRPGPRRSTARTSA